MIIIIVYHEFSIVNADKKIAKRGLHVTHEFADTFCVCCTRDWHFGISGEN